MIQPRSVVLLAPVSILGLFATSLLGIDRLAFRDVSHFYAPLYDYVAERTEQTWLPLWNPLDHTGIPLMGETTTAVLYPPRILIFGLPWDSTTALNWYLISHLLLAAWTSYIAARWSSMSATAATAASIIYPLSGSVLFLYCNPPFLCGAAWLPLLLGSLIAAPHLTTAKRTLIASSSMAMMVLAGDPQTALHGMLLATLVWTGRKCFRRASSTSASTLVASAILAAMMAAPQIAASMSWSRLSERSTQHESYSMWRPPSVGSRKEQSFQYSVPPWHLVELATPQAFGSLLPEHQRLSTRLPGDGRMWTPSLYMGLLTLLAFGSTLGRWRSNECGPWLFVTLAGITFALGHFGVVWVLQNLTPWLSSVDSAVGGPYWFAYHFLPGYDAFRYPAKWLSLFSLGATIITAASVDRWLAEPPNRRWFVAVGIGVLSATCIVALANWNTAWPFDHSVTQPQDLFWGPLRMRDGLHQILTSCLHSCCVWIALAAIFGLTARRRWQEERVATLLLVVLVIDVTVAATGLVYGVDTADEHRIVDQFQQLPKVASNSVQPTRTMRTQYGGGWPASWQAASSKNRLLEVEASQRLAWFGRWHLYDRSAVFNSMVSIRSRSMASFWSAAGNISASLSPEQNNQFWQAIRRWLYIQSVRHMSDRSQSFSVEDLRVSTGNDLQIVDVQVRQSPPPRPMIHWDWTLSPSFPENDSDFEDRLRQIWNDQQSPPIVQSDHPSEVSPAEPGRAHITQIQASAEFEEFTLEVTSPALFVRPMFQDGHWRALARPESQSNWTTVEVAPVDGLMQGIVLPAGTWHLRFEYRPQWLPWSVTISVLGWLAFAVLWLRCYRDSRQAPSNT